MAVRTDPEGICGLCKQPYDDHANWSKWPDLKCPEKKE